MTHLKKINIFVLKFSLCLFLLSHTSAVNSQDLNKSTAISTANYQQEPIQQKQQLIPYQSNQQIVEQSIYRQANFKRYFSENGAGAGSDLSAQKQAEMEAIGEAMANPLSYLWLGFMQNDTIWYDGDIADALDEDPKVQNTFMINPVLSMQLTEQWKMVFRPVIPINSFETVDNLTIDPPMGGELGSIGTDFNRETGLGDIVLWTAFSKQYKPPFIFGFGPTIMLNTASKDYLGTGKNAAGPMALAFNITDQWIVGTIAQHWWSFSGDDYTDVKINDMVIERKRPDVNLTDVQPVIRYRLSQTTNMGLAPNIRYNWETDQLSLPLGGGFDTLVKIGPLPVKIGVEAYYYVEKDDNFGPDWQLRFFFVPVFPSPEWSKQPLFN